MSNIDNVLEHIIEKCNAPDDFIMECEEKYNNKINKIAQLIFEKEVSEIVMIAGPSSAGKTTTAKKLRQALKEKGIESYTVSLDDFYLDNKDAPRFPDGTPDFETVECLDIRCFQDKMKELLEKGETELPEFDFLKGERYPNEEDWRGPRNFAESMMCFGYASYLLDNYKTKLNEMSSEELIKLYKEL